METKQILSPVELAILHNRVIPRDAKASSSRYEGIHSMLHQGSRYWCPTLGVSLIKRPKGFELDFDWSPNATS